MTVRLSSGPTAWRPALPTDLAAIVRLAALVHPNYPERPVVFADRLALHPSGMLLAKHDEHPVGYAIGHPWHGPAPLLDHCLGNLPPHPDSYWVHDVAVLTSARGHGIGRAVLPLLRADASHHGLHRLRLIAVGKARPFWTAAGFTAVPDRVPSRYGDGASAMQLDLGPSDLDDKAGTRRRAG